MTHEVEGSHALISASLARRYNETQGVVHAIEAHHYEVQPQTVESVLLIAADAISASRPGARGESLEHYIKRLTSLEEIAMSKPGVAKAYALQAGREIRVIVEPTGVYHKLLLRIAVSLGFQTALVDASHVKHAKPEPDLLLLAAKEVGVEPAHCWYIGDSTWDMVSAVAAGMIAIGVYAGSAVNPGALEAAGAAAVVPTLNEVAAALGGET